MVDSVYRTRSLGVAAEGIPDQYADGKAAKVSTFYGASCFMPIALDMIFLWVYL